ncbi:MAG: DUF1788 domain-containing protein [Bacteroidales bacterium]|nr:DUF1788 domain-containing protein [Bacteroidales bacterium]
MTLEELYQRLIEEDFKDPATGNLFFPVYLYLYPPEKEFEMRKEIDTLRDRISRPNEFLQATVLDIFDLLIEYLRSKAFGKKMNLLEFHLESEKNKPFESISLLSQDANSESFFHFVNDRIHEKLKLPSQLDKVYVFLQGFGRIFPYLRMNRFLTGFEKYIKGEFKMILFYPGELKDNLSLFGVLEDGKHYRSIYLINEQKVI